MGDQHERELARGLRAGQADAWRALYDAHAARVWRAVARLLGPGSADVADVVQETFLAAARSAATFDPERGSLGMWLAGIARRHVALHYRKQARQDRLRRAAEWLSSQGPLLGWLEGRGDEPGDSLESAELAALVRNTLTELPLDYEALLTAKYLDGDSVDQIAEREESTPVAVRSKLARARQAFREAFRKYSAPIEAPARTSNPV